MSSRESRRKKVEEVLEGGRDLGTLSRTDPELWEWLKAESATTGRKKHEIIRDALARLAIERKVIAAGLTMEQMLAAWEVKDMIEAHLIDKIMKFGTTFIQSFLMQIGEMINAIQYERQRQLEEVIEEEKKRDIEFQMRKTQAQLASTLLQAMMPMIMQTMAQINPQIGKMLPQIMQQTTQPTQPQQATQQTGMELEVI
jgi:hypothetical protein